jgi:hypothetical protein
MKGPATALRGPAMSASAALRCASFMSRISIGGSRIVISLSMRQPDHAGNELSYA